MTRAGCTLMEPPGSPRNVHFWTTTTRVGPSGIRRTIHLPHLSQHGAAVGISSAIFAKAACALINVCQTGAKEAIFASTKAARSWPFWQDWSHGSHVPSTHPLDIAGPTYEKLINRIGVSRQDHVSSFLRHIQEEQRQLTKYAHAPLLASMLATEQIPSGPNSGRANILDNLLRRQTFKWNPAPRAGTHLTHLEQVQHESISDSGLQLNCKLVNEETLFVRVMWDFAQLRMGEVQGAMQVFVRAVEWLAGPENWERRIGECGLMC